MWCYRWVLDCNALVKVEKNAIHGPIPITARHTHRVTTSSMKCLLNYTFFRTLNSLRRQKVPLTQPRALQDRLSCVWNRSKIRLVCALSMERLKMCGKMRIVAKPIFQNAKGMLYVDHMSDSFIWSGSACSAQKAEILPDLCLPAITCVHRWIW